MMKVLCNQIRNFFEQHDIARILLYIVAMIQPISYLFFGNWVSDMVQYLWISFYSCLLLAITFPRNRVEKIFSIALIAFNLIPIGLLFFGSLMLFPVGPILAFLYLWIPVIPGVSKEVSIGIFMIVLLLMIALVGKTKAKEKMQDDE